jgi:hypothetical protein
MYNEYNPFGVDANHTTSQGRVAKSATLPWALRCNRFAVEAKITTFYKKYAVLGVPPGSGTEARAPKVTEIESIPGFPFSFDNGQRLPSGIEFDSPAFGSRNRNRL